MRKFINILSGVKPLWASTQLPLVRLSVSPQPYQVGEGLQ